MNRLQKKCLLGSGLLHGLLCVIFIVGSAFRSSDSGESLPPIVTIVPVNLTDGASHGGSPDAGPPASSMKKTEPVETAPPPPVQQPVQQPPQETKATPPPPDPTPEPPKAVEPPKKIVEPAPPKAIEKLALKPIPAPDPKKKVTEKIDKNDFKPVNQTKEQTKETSKKQPLQLKAVKTNTAYDAKKVAAQREAERQAQAAAQQQRKAWNEALNTITGAQHDIETRGSGKTTIEMPGPGGGGPASINYAQFVKAVYDEAWLDPADVADESAVVKTEIVIRRDGSIASSRIIGKSGIPALDKSVQRALDRVRAVRPFPDGSSDSQRTFIIKFNLKAKRSLG